MEELTGRDFHFITNDWMKIMAGREDPQIKVNIFSGLILSDR
jgi:hypothetical protein